ncbi:hypothetical protein AB1K70_26225 [Bremerella sp. JC770]|uniref:hypothetical protein n=1 Tax=Bremerella sp. JC770 TaxID=3232137 RepID=UPI00345B4B08
MIRFPKAGRAPRERGSRSGYQASDPRHAGPTLDREHAKRLRHADEDDGMAPGLGLTAICVVGLTQDFCRSMSR